MDPWERLRELKQEFDGIEAALGQPEVLADQREMVRLSRRRAEIEPLVRRYEERERLEKELGQARELLDDPELREVAREEERGLRERLRAAEEELKEALTPKDAHAHRNVIVEIRAGTGGDEAALFARDLYRMYARFAERRGWRSEVINLNATGLSGVKEIVFSLEGDEAYANLKYESGVHRVQRVPVTEAGGRIHTSAATVAVLPEAEEVEVEINPDDLEWDTFHASSAGGQHVNKTSSAVRVTHTPTGTVVTCQAERSQHQNREKALRVLRAHLLEVKQREMEERIAAERRAQVRGGDRSEKIRTYNFPQRRVTDHRIGFSLYNLEAFMDGAIQELIDRLREADGVRALEGQA